MPIIPPPRSPSLSDETPAYQNLILGLLFLTILPVSIFFRGISIKFLFGWFLTPLGFPVLGWWHALGVSLVCQALTLSYSLPKNTEHTSKDATALLPDLETREDAYLTFTRSLVAVLVTNGVLLGIGAAYHAFM